MDSGRWVMKNKATRYDNLLGLEESKDNIKLNKEFHYAKTYILHQPLSFH